jgi:hypothetical protein
MKIKFIFFIILFGTLNCNAQWFLDHTREQINLKINDVIYKSKDQFDFYTWHDSQIKSMICVTYEKNMGYPKSVFISPDDSQSVNNFVTMLNKDYVVISPYEWREYTNTKILVIKYDTVLMKNRTSFIFEYL